MSSGHHFNLHISHHGKETSHDSHPQPSSEFPVSDHPEDSVDETNDDSHLKESVDQIPPRLRVLSRSPQLDIDLPQSALDLSTTFDSILSETSHVEAPEVEKVQKRASNVMKLAQENEKLKEELRAMTERLEAAERRQQELSLKGSQKDDTTDDTTPAAQQPTSPA